MMLADCGQDFVTDPNLLALACEDAEVFGDWVMPDYRRIAAELGRTPESTVFSIEDSDYGSGWASFVEIRLARRGAEPEIRDGYQVTRYASVVVCRIAPLAALMKVVEARVALDGKGSCGYLPVSDDLVSAVPWDTRQRIPEILANYGYQILAPEIGRLRLPDGLGVDTLLTSKDEKDCYIGHHVFDAWFHWMD
ncbi:hypothetical protein ACLUXI_05835 [Bifidobacterium apri]|uniref:hypothetical protein n=2 Tax=Bifidobacterium TaxID=1678 RepID=UPI000C70D52B|nr:hypothetical protein [Bifidobacterium thermophilum]MBM6982227.1 hypothetical protein [Bifidobacterium thermophilum]PKU88323.1 hypothetical protein CQR48_1582 [Bifidobacterium thermophilum]